MDKSGNVSVMWLKSTKVLVAAFLVLIAVGLFTMWFMKRRDRHEACNRSSEEQ